MSGYSRQSLADIVATEVVKAAPLNAEFNALRDAFIVASGHKHDGTAEEGAYVPLISDTDAYNKVVIDSGNNRVQFFVEVSSAAVEQMRLQDGALVPVTDNDIDLGTSGVEFKDLYLDGTAKIDTLTVDENATVAGTLNVTGNVTLTADLAINGNTTIGDAATDTVTITADVASPLIPSADDTYDIGAVGSEWRNLYIDGTANIDSLVADTADINAGTIDGTTIGGNSAAAGSFTTLAASSNATVGGTLTVTGGTTLSSTVTVTGTATFNGNTVIGSDATDTVTVTADVASNLIPSADNTYDLGASGSEWKDLYIDGTANIDSLVADTADINAGTIDGTVIGGSTAAAITGTTITANTNFVGNITGNVTSTGTSSFATVTTSGNVTIGGDLTVNGTTTTVSTTNTVIEDTLIEIGNGTTGAPANDAGIVIERGSENNAFIGFDESADKFIVGTGTFTGASTGDLTITTGTLVANLEGNVSGNVTGNVTGDLTGNVTAATGTSSFATLDFDDITDGTITITGFVDEDDMVSNSATLLPTQQSVKKYVDDEILNNYNVFGLTATGTELNVLDGDTAPASVTLVGTDGFPVNDAGVTKLALISDIADYIESVTLTSATLANPTVSGLYLSDSGFVVEGSSADANETTVTFTNPTTDRTITFPDATGTVFLTDGSGNVDINGGTIDGVTIGGASAGAGTFTTLTATGDVDIADKIVHTGDTNTAIRFPAADTVTVETAGSERLRITSTGLVGIGATSPDSNLHISDASGAVLKIESTGTGLGAGSVIGDIQFYGNDASTPGAGIKAGIKVETVASLGDDAQMKFTTSDGTTNNLTRMIIANNGDISFYENTGTTPKFFWDASAEALGIGTSSIATGAALDVVSTGTRGVKVSRTATSPSNDTYTLEVDNSAQTANVTTAGALKVTNNNGSGLLIDGKGDVSLYDDSGVAKFFWDASAERLGIGTTSPATTLDVNGDVTITDKIVHSGDTNTAIRFPAADTVTVETGGTERMRINSAGNVGIGTSSPNANLELGPVSATQGPTLRLSAGAGGIAGIPAYPYGTIEFYSGDTSGSGASVRATIAGMADTASAEPGSYLTFSTRPAGTASLTERMIITSTGNVGIGTSSPAQKLEVSGSVYVNGTDGQGFQLNNSSITRASSTAMAFNTGGSERLRIDSSGNVLIGGTTAGTASAGNLVLVNGTAPTGNVTNGITLFAEDVSSSSELKVRDEAGNVTTLSPHNFDLIPEGPSEEMAWSYYSERDGKRINVDMLKAIRLLEQITGEKLVHMT